MATGRRALRAARVFSSIRMGTLTMVSGDQTSAMGSVSTKIRTRPSMRASGKMTYSQDMAQKNGLKAQNTKESTKRAKNRDSESTRGQTAHCTLETGMITK